MTQYKYTAEASEHFCKHGVDLTVYQQPDPSVSVVHIHVEAGHFQEFYNTRSTYLCYIICGLGTFYLNDEVVQVRATDLVAIPPGTRIYYLGTMEILLTVSPAFDESNERHVRFIREETSKEVQP